MKSIAVKWDHLNPCWVICTQPNMARSAPKVRRMFRVKSYTEVKKKWVVSVVTIGTLVAYGGCILQVMKLARGQTNTDGPRIRSTRLWVPYLGGWKLENSVCVPNWGWLLCVLACGIHVDMAISCRGLRTEGQETGWSMVSSRRHLLMLELLFYISSSTPTAGL